jgi:hypothetical protein
MKEVWVVFFFTFLFSSSFFPCQKLTWCDGQTKFQSHNLMVIPIFFVFHVLQHKFLNGDDDGTTTNVQGLGWNQQVTKEEATRNRKKN